MRLREFTEMLVTILYYGTMFSALIFLAVVVLAGFAK